jgi:hypothetical protein
MKSANLAIENIWATLYESQVSHLQKISSFWDIGSNSTGNLWGKAL